MTGVQVAIRLLGHVWGSGAMAPVVVARRRDRVVETREPSRWNPSSLADDAAAPDVRDAAAAEPVWAETEPWCHD